MYLEVNLKLYYGTYLLRCSVSNYCSFILCSAFFITNLPALKGETSTHSHTLNMSSLKVKITSNLTRKPFDNLTFNAPG